MEFINYLHKQESLLNQGRKIIFFPYLKFFLLPALTAIFPTLFYYANNVYKLLLRHLFRTTLTYLLIAIVVYILLLVIWRKGPLRAAMATFIFLIFVNIYGVLEKLFIQLDWFPVRAYTTLPLILVFVFYSIWLFNKLNTQSAAKLWDAAVIVSIALVAINLVKIVPAELAKRGNAGPIHSGASQTNLAANQGTPDIYYILLDEFAGFKPMREYWHNPKVDEFSAFLTSKGFEIIEESHGSSIDSVHQMASRLNYQNYPFSVDQSVINQWFSAIADNKVMAYLKKTGYTTITFNELLYPFPAVKPITADIAYNYADIPATDLGLYFDDFWIMVADNTMLKELSKYYKRLGSDQHTNFVFFTTKKIGDLGDVHSPKFVYAHLMLPHAPFLFDENGNLNPPSAYIDYGYYLGNYNFSMLLVEKMVNGILEDADPANPPVIILQSDHGLRNFADNYKGQLPNYPEEYKTSILYARLMPGYRSSGSAQEIDPINTFPIVFNYLFDAGIPLK